MLRFHEDTSVVAFQLLYFGWASQPKGKCCLPKSLGRHQMCQKEMSRSSKAVLFGMS